MKVCSGFARVRALKPNLHNDYSNKPHQKYKLARSPLRFLLPTQLFSVKFCSSAQPKTKIRFDRILAKLGCFRTSDLNCWIGVQPFRYLWFYKILHEQRNSTQFLGVCKTRNTPEHPRNTSTVRNTIEHQK